MGQHARNAFGRDLSSIETDAEELAGEKVGLLAGAHCKEKAERLKD
jgi:hypothetical protein